MEYTIDRSHLSPNFWTPDEYERLTGHRRQIKVLVIHKSEGGLDDGIGWLCNPASQVSAHYVVSRTGQIFELVSPANIAWHCGESVKSNKKDGLFRSIIGWGNENADTIGVELVGLPDEIITEAQYQALAWLQVKYSIPLDSAHTIQHKEITVRKQDCQLFDVNHYWGIVQGIEADPSIFFTETGYAVKGGFLDLWNSYEALEPGLALKTFGYPLSNEYIVRDSKLGDVTYQDFENLKVQWYPGVAPRICAGIRELKYEG